MPEWWQNKTTSQGWFYTNSLVYWNNIEWKNTMEFWCNVNWVWKSHILFENKKLSNKMDEFVLNDK
jgi:hypothetical protein